MAISLRKLIRRSYLDVVVLVAAFWGAYLLRFDFAIPEDSMRSMMIMTPFVVLVQTLVLRRFGIHRAVGRYISLDDLNLFLWSAIIWLIPMLGVRYLLPAGDWRIPTSVALMDTVLAVVGILGVRIAQRLQAEVWHAAEEVGKTKPVLLVGAGGAGAKVARELSRGRGELRVVGYVDDDLKKHDSVVSGKTVLGSTEDIPRLVDEYDVDHVIITIADRVPGVLRRIVGICGSVPVRARTIPSFLDIVQGARAITAFQDVDIEDLLGRDPVDLDTDAEVDKLIEGRTVVVTGAGGSIGSELARQAISFSPAQLLLVERFEGALFEIDRELQQTHPHVSLVPLVADITDEQRMRGIFEQYVPDVVVHAAAHKHVAMMEDNPGEAIKNNALGTRLVAQLAGESKANCFIQVSTDKAVRPTSIMGASKRLAEMIVQNCNEIYPDTRFVSVRCGNVLGSSGSVIPIFKAQVRAGGPVTVTHEDATRYFMTIPEASRLVLTAGAMGEGGEVMILDMGKPVRILDLARNLIQLSGFVPDHDIPIEITGLKPGEKLSEELYSETENMGLTRHPKVFVGTVSEYSGIDAVLDDLVAAASSGDDDRIRRLMAAALNSDGARLNQTADSDSERVDGPVEGA